MASGLMGDAKLGKLGVIIAVSLAGSSNTCEIAGDSHIRVLF